MQEHLLVKIALAYLTFTLRATPPHTFKPYGMIVQLSSIPINFMGIRSTMLSLWDIWYGTHKKWREELVGYSSSVFFLFSGRLMTDNLSISKSKNKETDQCNIITNQFNITTFAFLFTLTPIQVCHPPSPPLWYQRIQMEERHYMAWGPWQRQSHPTLKDRIFDGFHSNFTIQVIKLS